jgi:hypothetical protein
MTTKTYVIILIFINCFFESFTNKESNLNEFLHDLLKHTEDFIIKNLENISKETKNEEIVQLKKNINSFHQSGKITKLAGIKDKDFSKIIKKISNKLKFLEDEDKKKILTEYLEKIIEDETDDWKSYEIAYTKNYKIFYTIFFTQHNKKQAKSVFYYFETNYSLEKTDIFVVSTSKKIENNIFENIEVLRKNPNLNDIYVKMMIKFLEISAIENFIKYFKINN